MNGQVLDGGTGTEPAGRPLENRLDYAEHDSTTLALDAFDVDEMVFPHVITTGGTGSTHERWVSVTAIRGSIHRIVVSNETASTRALLMAAAAANPAGDVELPAVPELTGNVVDDSAALFGMTKAELASLFEVTERQLYRWQSSGIPDDRRRQFEALVAAGALVIGGLGAHGAGEWLKSGSPSAVDLIKSGRTEELRERALQLTDSPAS